HAGLLGPVLAPGNGLRSEHGPERAQPRVALRKCPLALFFAGTDLIQGSMERPGGWIERIALAMAGKRSPWGKPSGSDGGDGSGDEGATPPSGEDPPKGPRNPWLPGGGSE